MPPNVGGDERAERDDREAAAACVLERVADEPRPEPPPLARRVALGVRERDAVAAHDLVAVALGHVDDDRVLRRRVDRLAGAVEAEALDELTHRIRLARVGVLDEAQTVIRGMLPRLERLEMPVDRAGPDDDLAVVELEDRDRVRPGDAPQLAPVLRIRLDLLRDEVEAELRQHLADGGRVRTPLRLPQGQHGTLRLAPAAEDEAAEREPEAERP